MQPNRIKDQMLSKNYVKENNALKLRHNCINKFDIDNMNNINKKDPERQINNQKIEQSILKSERVLMRKAYNGNI